MDRQTRRFLEETDILFACARCGAGIHAGFKDAGKTITCNKCGLKIIIDRKVRTDIESEDLLPAIDEYLLDIRSSEKAK